MTRARSSTPDSDDTSSSSGDEGDTEVKPVDSWVACDRCSKWRRVPAGIADSLAEDTPWYCEHNPNKLLASCGVPQELTNEQIDAINEEGEPDEDVEDVQMSEERARRRRIPAVWQLIKDNVLTHRKRKVQEEDDVMICNCKPHWRGGDGCGPDCINRMLCVECAAGFCPSEDRCTNQVFTKKQYAKLEVRRAGPKGFGLFALENIVAGQFIIEYIGEVLEEEEYLRRKDFYAEVGQRHYYFMNIGNGEVIDACRKGNRARFINHSCDPNCETQKWLARGELAIGLFALKDIALGEELTFDYNFERYGDKPMRCYCASRTCRKFIGGTQDTYDEKMIVIDPEDVTNDFQPVMLTDPDMDWAAKALLDWRVGVLWDKEKEPPILNKLERVCKARGVPWTPAHFHGTAPMPHAQSGEALLEPEPNAVKAGAGRARAASRKAAAGAPAAGKEAKEAPASRKAGGKAAAAGQADAEASVKAEVSEPAPVKVEEGAVKEEEQTAFRGPLKAAYKAKAKEQQDKTDTGSPKAADTKPLPGSVPHPGALFAAVKAPVVPRKRGAAAAAANGGPAKTEASLASSASTALANGSQRRGAGAASVSDRAETGAVTSSQMSAMTDVKDSLLIKTADGLAKEGVLVPIKEEPGRERDKEREAKEAQSREEREQPAVPAAKPTTSTGSGGAGSAGTVPVKRKPVAVTPASRRGMGKRRSEIDRRLDQLVGPSGRMKEASKQNIIKVLRMFNLCDIGPTRIAQRPVPGALRADSPVPDACTADAPATAADGTDKPPRAGSQPPATGHTGSDADALSTVTAPTSQIPRPPQGGDDDGPPLFIERPAANGPPSTLLPPPDLPPALLTLSAARVPSPALPVPSAQLPPLPRDRHMAQQQAQQPVVITARQRARMADLSLLLDVILKTSSATVRKDFVTCGVLNQLHQAIGRNLSVQYSVILRKILRAVEALPLTADDIYSVRTAHGTLADTLQELSTNQDYDVRNKAGALLKKFPPSACQDQGLVQRATGPNRRTATGFSPALAPQPGAAPDGQQEVGAGLPPLRHRLGLQLRGNVPRGTSNMDLQHMQQHGLGSVPASPAVLAPDSPLLVPQQQGEGSEGHQGTEPLPKRRRRGFTDGPQPPPGEASGQQQGDERGPVAAPGMNGHGPGPQKPLPYSYRHGSALLDHTPGGGPPPPPLDAEELFELLLVPEVVERRRPGYKDPKPPVRPVNPPPGAPHGEPSDMEVLFAVGVYDTNWEEAAQAVASTRSNSRGKRAADAPPSPQQPVPMSPLGYSVTNSPTRPHIEQLEVAAEQAAAVAAEQARLAKLAQMAQARHQHAGLPPRHSFEHAAGGMPGSGGMPMIMDLRPGGRPMGTLAPPGGGPRTASPVLPHGGFTPDILDLSHQGGRPMGMAAMHGAQHRSRHMTQIMSLQQQQQQPPDSPLLMGSNGQQSGMHMAQGPQGGPHMGHGAPSGRGGAPATQPATAAVDADSAEWARSMGTDYPESWDEPDHSFEQFVREMVRYRLGKYVTTPDHPNRITSEDAHALFKKITREVVDKERHAFEGRRVQGLFKLIEKKKVEHNLKEFVRSSIRRAHIQH